MDVKEMALLAILGGGRAMEGFLQMHGVAFHLYDPNTFDDDAEDGVLYSHGSTIDAARLTALVGVGRTDEAVAWVEERSRQDAERMLGVWKRDLELDCLLLERAIERDEIRANPYPVTVDEDHCPRCGRHAEWQPGWFDEEGLTFITCYACDWKFVIRDGMVVDVQRSY